MTRGEVIHKAKNIVLTTILMMTFIWGFILIIPDNSEGALRFVGPDSTYAELGDALVNSDQGDIIVLGEGTHNGSFISDVGGIVIRGNSSTKSILVLNGSQTSILNGNNIILKDLTVTNGTLMVRGNSFNGSNLIVDSDGASLRFENQTWASLYNVTFNNMTGTGLRVDNCTSFTARNTYFMGNGGDIVHVTDSNTIAFHHILQDLYNSSRGLLYEDTDGIVISDMMCRGYDDTVHGMDIRNCTNININESTIALKGIGISLNGSKNIGITDTLSNPHKNGSIGIFTEMSNNIIVNGLTQTIEYESIGMQTYLTGSLKSINSAIMIKGSGTGIQMIDSYNLTFEQLSMRGEGDDSNGIISTGNDGVIIHGTDWTGSGISSEFCQISRSSAVEINDSTVTIQGLSSKGINETGDSIDLSFHDLDFRTSGRGSQGIVTNGARDSLIFNNSFMVSGSSAFGLYINGFNLTTWANILTITGNDAVGSYITGESINMFSDRSYPIGEGSCGVKGEDLIKMQIRGCSIRSTGQNSNSIYMTGLSGNYHLSHLNISGDQDAGVQLMLRDQNGMVYMDNITINSDSTEPALSLECYKGEISGSKFIGNGPGIFVDDTDHLDISGSDLFGQIPIISMGSEMIIYNCDMGSGSQSIEAMSGSFIRVLDTPIKGVLIDPTSNVIISNTIKVRIEDRFSKPIPDMDMMITRQGTEIYATEHFNESDPDPKTDIDGEIGPMILDHIIYQGEPVPLMIENNITVYRLGTSGNAWDSEYTLDTSLPGTRTIVSPDIDIPQTPLNLEAMPLDARQGLLLTWISNDDDTIEYRIYELDMNDMSTWNRVDVVDHPTSTWSSPDIGPEERRIYRITAWDGTYESFESNIATAVTLDLTPPLPPGDISLVNVDQTSITISWTYTYDDEIESFEIYMNGSQGMNMQKIAQLESDARTYKISGLTWKTTYRFRMTAIDASGNPSGMSPVLEVTTASLVLTARVEAYYNPEGPLSGLPVFNGTARLVSFNGTVEATAILDSLGRASFNGLSLDEIYTIHITPPDQFTGEYNETDGYIPMASGSFQLSPDDPEVLINITLPYYWLPVKGSIKIEVIYGTGPRSGPVYQATVDLLDENDLTIGQMLTDADGTARFTVNYLPFRGRFHVSTPEGISGSVEEKKSGYLSQTTNFFLLERTNPDQSLQVQLIHYTHTPPPDDLLVEKYSPTGFDVDLDAPLIIKFNQPVNRESIIANLKVMPALSGLTMKWDEWGRNLTIDHDGFLPEVKYTIRIEWGAMSLKNTTFPADYSSNTWTFTTIKETDGQDDDQNGNISNQVLFAILIGIIIVILIIGFYIWSSRNRDEVMDEDDVYALSDQDYYDDDYPEEEDYYDDDEEYYDEEITDQDEYLEDEDLAEEEHPEEESILEDEEIIEEDDLKEEETIPKEEEPEEEKILPEEEDSFDPEEEEMMEEEEEIPKKKKKR